MKYTVNGSIERVQFSSVAGARLFSLGKIQMRISFGDLESKGISHLFHVMYGEFWGEEYTGENHSVM